MVKGFQVIQCTLVAGPAVLVLSGQARVLEKAACCLLCTTHELRLGCAFLNEFFYKIRRITCLMHENDVKFRLQRHKVSCRFCCIPELKICNRPNGL